MNAKNDIRGKGSTLSAWVPETVQDEISSRAERIGLTRSRFVTLVLDHWVRQGCPPVSKADEVLWQLTKDEPDSGTMEVNEE